MGGPAEHPELWAFLESLQRGERLAGAVAAIERFGVFVALDDGPDHPVFPGVGFITMPELSCYLLAKPVPRPTIIFTKLLVAIGVTVAFSALP
ncbi:hypothetical protein ACWD6P_22365, partial [Streptomyces sp. NPDC002446]